MLHLSLLTRIDICCNYNSQWTSRVPIEGKTISKAAQSRGKSSIKLHNLFLKNVGPVIIIAAVCRLTGCRSCGNPMFRRVAVLYTINMYHNGHASGNKVWPDDKLKRSVFALILGFFGYKRFARPNWDANSWEEGMTIDTNSSISPETIEQELRTAVGRGLIPARTRLVILGEKTWHSTLETVSLCLSDETLKAVGHFYLVGLCQGK